MKFSCIVRHITSGWQLIQTSPIFRTPKTLSSTYALYINDRFISEARGEQLFLGLDNEIRNQSLNRSKYVALVRCCKDIGIASELWDPYYSKLLKSQLLNYSIRKMNPAQL